MHGCVISVTKILPGKVAQNEKLIFPTISKYQKNKKFEQKIRD
jgi:hypothetical protein